jgi:hypothetical protein
MDSATVLMAARSSNFSPAPFIVFVAFLVLFAVRARRRGQSVNEYLRSRNRETFLNLRPGWWKPHVVFALVVWMVVWISSGFKLIVLVALPLVLVWVPFWGTAIGWYYRRFKP